MSVDINDGLKNRGSCVGFGQAQLAGDQAGEQGVAEGGEGLGLLSVVSPARFEP